MKKNSLRLGKLKLTDPFMLAPLSGISDLPFRKANRKHGCTFAFVEMINARSLSYRSKKTKQMLSASPRDKPLGVQLIGCEEEYINKALDIITCFDHFDLIDFNAACPAKKVVRRGEGAALLKNPKKLHALLSLMARKLSVPVTVKIRSGWDQDSVNAVEVARAAQDAGAAAIFIHGRTRQQYYSGTIDYESIRAVKKAVRIPVIASGNIFSPRDIKQMFKTTDCDGVLIARGALGNPWIFKHTKEFLKNESANFSISIGELAKQMHTHLKDSIEFYGEKLGVVRFRKFYAWYTKGIANVRSLRQQSSQAKTKNSMASLIDALTQQHKAAHRYSVYK